MWQHGYESNGYIKAGLYLEGKTMPTKGRSRTPIMFIVNIVIYAIGVGAVTCYWFVCNYGGTMPPPGSFGHFITDVGEWLAVILLSPIALTLITNYFLRKKGRSTDA